MSGIVGSDRGTLAHDSISDAMRELRRRPRELWLDLARGNQSDRWRHGSGVAAEEYFAHLPELRTETEEALVLICGEIQLRRETGAGPELEEYQARFPALAGEIALQFAVDSILDDGDAPAAGDQQQVEGACQLPTLQGYEFLEVIGSGAAGVVYRARQVSLDRDVAIKVLSTSGADPKRLARQRQEAEILGHLRHPNVVHVYEVIEQAGCLFLVMELVAGSTLKEFAAGKPLPAKDAADLVRTLAETMQAVHEAGVLHRDLKPSNVLIRTIERVKISDFGLAKLRSGDNLLTTADSVLGTPSYMSPEQALGAPTSAGPATDVYSLGAILYELLTGRPPFLGATLLDTLSLIRDQDPVPPRQLQPTTPSDLDTICLHCLNKSPLNRYLSAAALSDDLRRFLDGVPILARRSNAAERFVRWCRRKPAVAALLSLVALLLVTTVAILAVSNANIRREAAAKDAALATARQAVDQMLMRVANDKLSNMALGHPLREALLQDALLFYEGFAAQSTADPTIRETMADVLRSLGFLEREMGRCDDACRSFQRSIELLESIEDSDPQPPAIRERLAKTQEALAYTWQINPADPEGREADAHYRQTLQMYRDLERDWPERRQPVVLCLQRLGELAFNRGESKKAEEFWRDAITHGEAYIAQHPENTDARSNICWSCANLADAILLRSPDRIPDAEPVIKTGLEHAKIVLELQPRSGQAREVMAFLHLRLAQFYCRTDRVDEALPFMQQAATEIESLCSEFPWYKPHWDNAIHIHNEVVWSLQSADREEDAKDALRRMVEWIRSVAPQLPDEPIPQSQLLRCRDNLVERLRSFGQEREANELQDALQPRNDRESQSPSDKFRRDESHSKPPLRRDIPLPPQLASSGGDASTGSKS